MKITQILKEPKGKEELYNDGNRKFENIKQTQEVEHVNFSKEDGYYFNVKSSTQQEINKNLTNIHEYKDIKESKDSQGVPSFSETKISGDMSIKDGLKEPKHISENGDKYYYDYRNIIPKEFNGHTNNLIDENGEVIGYQKNTDQDINSDYLLDSKTVSEKNGIIVSKIDGQIDWTNVQDTNISGDPNKSFRENAADFGMSVGKQATGSLGNALGFSNSDLNDTIGAFKNVGLGNDEVSAFDKDMNKLNTWKHDKFKEFHVFDWKPGQTIPPDLMGGDLANMVKDAGNMPFIPKESRDKFNQGFNKVKEIISPDPIKVVREAIRPTKGIVGNPEEIGIQDDLYGVQSVSNEGTDTVSFNWLKNPQLWNGFNKSEKEIRVINALKNKNTFNKVLGSLYIRPNAIYNETLNVIDEGGVGTFEIPFEFNPDISEGATQANYATETLMNRIGQFNVYTGTNLPTVSINLSYVALAPDELDEEDSSKISKQYSTDSWQYYWTNNRIEQIEYKLRSLVMPDVTYADYLIKPPLIEIHMGNPNGEDAESVGDLFKYPIGIYGSDASYANAEKVYLATSRTINNVSGDNSNRYKKYIVTSVQISNFNDDSFVWPSLYGRVWQNGKSGSPINHIKTAADAGVKGTGPGFNGYTRRTGFKATLQCVEVVENFLDIVPDFRAYYNAWNFKGQKADETSKYVKIMTNEKIQETTDYLGNKLAITNSIIADIATLDARLDAAFVEAYNIASMYKQTMKKSSRLKCFNDQTIGNGEEDINKNYYFANPEWFKDKKENDEGEGDQPGPAPAPNSNQLNNNAELTPTTKPEPAMFAATLLASPLDNGEQGAESEPLAPAPEIMSPGPEAQTDVGPSVSEINELLQKPIYFKINLPKLVEKFFDTLEENEKWEALGDQKNGMSNFIKTEGLKIIVNLLATPEIKNIYGSDPEDIGTKKYQDDNILLIGEDEEKYGKTIIGLPSNMGVDLVENYTDRECFALIYYIISQAKAYLSNAFGKIKEIDYPSDSERPDDTKSMLLSVMKNASSSSPIDIPDSYKKLYADGLPLKIFFDNLIKAATGPDGWFARENAELAKILLDIESIYKEKEELAKWRPMKTKILSNLSSNHILDVVVDNCDTSFKEAYNILYVESDLLEDLKKDGVVSSIKIYSVFKKIDKIIDNHYDAMASSFSTILKIIDCGFMDKEALLEVAASIVYSMLSSKYNIKGLDSKTINVSCQIRDGAGKKINLCAIEKPSDKEGEGEEEVKPEEKEKRNPFDLPCVYAKDMNEKLLSVSYVIDKMEESYKDSQKQMERLEKELDRFPLKMTNSYKKHFNSIKEIKFVDMEKEVDINKETTPDAAESVVERVEKSYKKFIDDNILPFIEGVANIKKELNNYYLQKKFTEIVGYDQDTLKIMQKDSADFTKIVIAKLKPLSKEYKKYSESTSVLKEEVYQEDFEDKIGQSNDIFLNQFKDESNGKIPNLYYNKNEAIKLQRTMKVAGSSTNHFSKLSGN